MYRLHLVRDRYASKYILSIEALRVRLMGSSHALTQASMCRSATPISCDLAVQLNPAHINLGLVVLLRCSTVPTRHDRDTFRAGTVRLSKSRPQTATLKAIHAPCAAGIASLEVILLKLEALQRAQILGETHFQHTTNRLHCFSI
jgi:hypothetical protein